MIFARNEDHLKEILAKFFTIHRRQRLVVSLSKSEFFRKEAFWCRWIMDAHGIFLKPKNISVLQDCGLPKVAGKVCEYIHGISWISASISLSLNVPVPLGTF